MPKLNKCVHRKKQYGYMQQKPNAMKFSTGIINYCDLVHDGTYFITPKVKCKGCNCGHYEENNVDKTNV